jgi:hypothetical protein
VLELVAESGGKKEIARPSTVEGTERLMHRVTIR